MKKHIKMLCLTIILLGMAVNFVVASEQVLFKNLAETDLGIGGLNLLDGSIDGSKYYQAIDWVDLPGLPTESMDLLVWSMDIRFDEEGSGFTPMNRRNNYGTCVRSRTMNGRYQLVVQTGGNSYTSYMEIDPEHWYHIELMGKFSAPDAFMYMLVWTYNDAGERTNLRIFDNVSTRNFWAGNHNGASFVKLEPNTSIDNLRIFRPSFDSVVLSTTSDVLLSGQDLQFEVNASRYGVELDLDGGVYFDIFDQNNEIRLDDTQIAIDDFGLLTVGPFAANQDIYVRAITADGSLTDENKITIQSNSLFEIQSIGFNNEFTSIVDVEVVKNFYYEGPAVFVIEVYDEHQNIVETATRNFASNVVPTAEPTLVSISYSLPDRFKQDTWQIKISTVSSIE